MPQLNQFFKLNINELHLRDEDDAKHLFDFLGGNSPELDWENKTYYLLMCYEVLDQHKDVASLNKLFKKGAERIRRLQDDIKREEDLEKEEEERDRKKAAEKEAENK